MTIIMVAVGAIVAASIFERFEFAIVGGVLGYLIAVIQQLKARLIQTETTVKYLSEKIDRSNLNNTHTTTPNRETVAQTITPPVDISADKSELPEEVSDQTSHYRYTAKKHSGVEPIIRSDIEEKAQEADASHSSFKHGQKTNTAVDESYQASALERLAGQTLEFIKNYFTQGNLAVRIGAIVLFFGVAFLLKYAAERGIFAIEYRLAATAVTGIGLLIFGWRLRLRSDQYGLIVQAIAIGLLYLTVFASYRLYDLLPAFAAFPLLILISALACMLAVLQNARTVAIYGITGGFLAPILASTGNGSHIGLFSYYAVLNIGIFSIAWFKSWRVLNFVGFFFTFAIGIVWGVLSYQTQWLLSSEFFLVLFFVLYTVIATLYANRQPPRLRGYVDGSLVFGLPIIYFGLQNSLLNNIEYGVATASFITGIFYAVLSWFLSRKGSKAQSLLRPSFNALSILFLSLTIPFALDGQWTAAAWAIEGAGLIWVGTKQNRWFAKYLGILLQPLGAFLFLEQVITDSKALTQIGSWLSIIMISAAALFSAFQLREKQPSQVSNFPVMNRLKKIDPALTLVLFIWGMLWWYIGAITNLMRWNTFDELGDILLVLPTVSAILWIVLARRFSWQSMLNMRWVWLLFITFSVQFYLSTHSHFLVENGRWFWPVLFILWYLSWILQSAAAHQSTIRIDSKAKEWNIDLLHLASFIVVTGVFLVELNWQLDWLITQFFDWILIVNGVALLGIFVFLTQFKRWPFTASMIYQKTASKIVLALLLLWALLGQFTRAGDFSGMFYVPVLNPLDLTLAVIISYLYLGSSAEAGRFQFSESTSLQSKLILRRQVLACFCFVWVTVILLRSLHHWQPVAYQIDSLFHSNLVQTSVSILWSMIAVFAAIVAHRIQSRQLWMVAAGLLLLVIVKLFIVDLANSGSIERIISFLGVGGLLLVVGYFAPLPPKVESRYPDDETENQQKTVLK